MNLNAAQLAGIRRRLAAGENLRGALAAVPGAIFTADVAALDAQVRRELIGAGPIIAPLLEEAAVTDVIVNGVQVWADRGQGMEKVAAELENEEATRALAVRLAASCGQRLDDASPIVDGTFPSGVRLHAVIPPLSAEGTLISLRTHRARVLTLAELEAGGSVDGEVARVVRALVERRANVLISGATGAGKTTFLNAMLSLIGAEQRILVIEESAELRPDHPHVVHLQVRKANVQGAGEVTMSDLVRAAMRMRPDRIVLGECEVALRRAHNQEYKITRLKQGHPTPGASAFGYRWVPVIHRDAEGTRYSIVEDEAVTVRRIYAEFLAGASLGQISRDLNTDGRTTRKDAKWYASMVRDVLMNPGYAALLAPSQLTGEYDLGKIDIEDCIDGAWEPIIEKEQLLASRARLVGRKPNHKGTARKWFLAGLAVCSVCKAPVEVRQRGDPRRPVLTAQVRRLASATTPTGASTDTSCATAISWVSSSPRTASQGSLSPMLLICSCPSPWL